LTARFLRAENPNVSSESGSIGQRLLKSLESCRIIRTFSDMTRRSSLLLQVDVSVPPSVPAQWSSVGITDAGNAEDESLLGVDKQPRIQHRNQSRGDPHTTLLMVSHKQKSPPWAQWTRRPTTRKRNSFDGNAEKSNQLLRLTNRTAPKR
jgi:hypothetical protein